MKRPRPHIPLSVRVQVAERQVRESGSVYWRVYQSAVATGELTFRTRLGHLLARLHADGMVEPQLDHDPALILREFNERTGVYTPSANDPDHLIYRAKADHQQKTTGRKPGAARTATVKGSDIGIKTKFAKLERKARQTIKPKGFGGTRKLQGRTSFPKQQRPFR